MNNFQILDSNLEKIEDVSKSVSNYYQHASTHFFTNFGQTQLGEFKTIKNLIDNIEIQITNLSVQIVGYFISDQRLERGLDLLSPDKQYSQLKELSNLHNLRSLSIRTNNLSQSNSQLVNLFLKWAENPIAKSQIISKYNDSLLLFRTLQNDQYELMGAFSKALYLFFNYESSSRQLKNYIINLDLRPLKY
jgi:hypothetical protein